MMPLGDELRADDQPRLAFGDVVDDLAQRAHGRHEIAGQDRGLHPRKALGHLLRHTLDARSAGHQRAFVLAAWADLGRGQGETAMVAGELMAETVLDQRRGALRTLDAMAAGPADRQRGIAAPVEEQEALLTALQRLDQRRDQWR